MGYALSKSTLSQRSARTKRKTVIDVAEFAILKSTKPKTNRAPRASSCRLRLRWRQLRRIALKLHNVPREITYVIKPSVFLLVVTPVLERFP